MTQLLRKPLGIRGEFTRQESLNQTNSRTILTENVTALGSLENVGWQGKYDTQNSMRVDRKRSWGVQQGVVQAVVHA